MWSCSVPDRSTVLYAHVSGRESVNLLILLECCQFQQGLDLTDAVQTLL
jgi:hypothetical protein